MAGVSAIAIKESLEELGTRLRAVEQPILKERLQVLYWLKQAHAPSVSQIAIAIGRHRGTVQKWLALYRAQGLEALLVVKPTPGGGNRVIPMWAEVALAKRLQEPSNGFSSYGKVQQWLLESLGVEAEYHAVYQMTRYRLKAKLKVARPQNIKQNRVQREAFKQTSQTTSTY
ncbi:helix-turn-helix domain-containing protein (plasmid) [Phormidium sp. CLA17]|uniref:helix-turn-helix domain-containing protein n=1 Tax=Leptolyngbya sp. Cla-17 TaxID=2803751 RepID=UPI00149184B0|nr:helix-turn-helix domain-containing protein [Leptolyngbya sp. Cla-17]MBM0740764.1 helix-turn-helix domain-containing protein [Leptolyngbya sp. Cla-17]MBM0740797.1 helix-turn-helix domain-containing protein [Leptolyngbya sp. Cla-17]MBM0742555.1 helix-turn-helix domain-containing protein [Leptolyngbya sp. Cla-17]MBM0743484.1 helix-turn-helix domain-containing protein [Leptolyngbya sp. Cla-17]MBM0744152.1 helix-turn-helix domain-containing protein [Leptolyngbya sp. Cla-17]